MLFAAVVGLFICLYRYVQKPCKIWAFGSLFFLTHFLSDYYWTIYILIIEDYPNTSAFLAYFGWNVSYLIMFLLLRQLQGKEEKKYFNPLILLPIPINIAQLILYLQFGGIFNNIWQGVFCTAIACFSLQGILYYLKNRKNNAPFPYFHVVSLIYMVSEYGMWTSSCFTFKNDFYNPYYYFSFFCVTTLLFISGAIRKTGRKSDALSENEDKKVDSNYVLLVQGIVTVIILGCCVGGFIFARWMRGRIDAVAFSSTLGTGYEIIALILFGISLALAILLLIVMIVIFVYDKKMRRKAVSEREIKGRFNFAFTLTVTFILMFFAVIYTSRLLYREAVSSLYSECENQISGIATNLSNYLNIAESILWVTGDSVDQMSQKGVDLDMIHDYIVVETEHQKSKFDSNFTGIYGYVEGAFLDGLNWEPPEGYDPKERDWYKYALEAGGDVTIVPPYLDMQTGEIIISVTKLLNDGESVMAVDVTMNHIQETVQDINIKGHGYGMVINNDGTIIAHKDHTRNGRNCSEVFGDDAFLKAVKETRNGRTEMVLDGFKYSIFVNEVLDEWYTVVIVKNNDLLSEVRIQLIINVGVYLIIFFLITFFYYMSYMNEQSASKMMEDLITGKQKQEYEAKVLKLEKTAADDANKAKSRFLADMSHEIRTPINAVLGMNEMILRETDSESIREYAGNIRSSGRALLALINSILDFSKIEDGKMEIVPVDYSTVEMIHYLHASIAERAAAKSLILIVEVDPTLPKMLHGDDMRISQVIMNLLTNAVKYTKNGEVRLSVRNSGVTDEDLLLFVEVSDTGIGIKEEDMPRLFESFERLEKEKNRNIEGTGLGMSIVTKLLSMMGSKLDAESVYGEGSKFSFVINQKIVDETPIGDEYLKLSRGTTEGKNVQTYHESFRAPEGYILIVDDTKMNLKVAKNLLKKTLLQIDTALSGDEALALCLYKKYDVIFMDQRMPGMDGTETLHKLKEQFEGVNLDTPVICLTADAISGARDRYLAEGFSDYLTKPIESTELEKMLLTYLPKEKIKRGEDEVMEFAANGNDEKTGRNDTNKKDGTNGDIIDFYPDDQSENSGDTAVKFKDPSVSKRFAELGIDVNAGLTYCQNDEEMYESVLAEYVSEKGEKLTNLSKYFAEENWKEYTVFVHSLKSSSKLIGATDLSKSAAALEAASNEGNSEYIKNNHEKTVAEYDRITTEISSILGIDENGSSNDEDEILEFLPE